jgi:large subunit ribosomal protein L9
LKPVEGLGGEGEQVRVRAGYARNFLFPRNIAVPLTIANRKQIEALQKAREAREARELEAAQALSDKISQVHIAIAVKTGEGGKMFGAVTAAELHQKLSEAGIEVDRKRVQLEAPIKTLGQHTIKVRLHAEVSAELAFDVVSENPIEDSAE